MNKTAHNALERQHKIPAFYIKKKYFLCFFFIQLMNLWTFFFFVSFPLWFMQCKMSEKHNVISVVTDKPFVFQFQHIVSAKNSFEGKSFRRLWEPQRGRTGVMERELFKIDGRAGWNKWWHNLKFYTLDRLLYLLAQSPFNARPSPSVWME